MLVEPAEEKMMMTMTRSNAELNKYFLSFSDSVAL